MTIKDLNAKEVCDFWPYVYNAVMPCHSIAFTCLAVAQHSTAQHSTANIAEQSRALFILLFGYFSDIQIHDFAEIKSKS